MNVYGNVELAESSIERRGAYAILKKEGKAGIVKNDLGYFLIGGGHEGEESDESCLLRESMEETGYTIEVGEYLNEVVEYVYVPEWDKTYCKIMRIYRAVLLERIREKTEMDHELIWVDLDFALENMYLHAQRDMLKKYFD